MTTEKDSINNGVYIDHKVSYIVSLDHFIHEELIEEQTIENSGHSGNMDHKKHIENRDNEHLKKYCKSIISKLVDAHNILVFGPAETKFELQKAIRDENTLKHVTEELLVTDVLNKNEAIHFVQNHFTKVKVSN